MLQHRFIKAGLPDFNFKRTQWYDTIRSDVKKYRFRLLLCSFTASICVPLFIVFRSPNACPPDILFASVVALALLCCEIIALVRFRKVKALVYLCLAQTPAATITVLYLSGWSLPVIFFLAVLPVLCIQLRGCSRGLFWYAVSFSIVAVAWSIQVAGAVRTLAAPVPIHDMAAATGASLFMCSLAWFSERRQESLIARLTDHFVFDSATGLPNREVLSQSMLPEAHYLFAIIKIENFSDLVALFGYEFSDVISQFASRKLRKYEDRFRYRTYQLKHNEYGILLNTADEMRVSDAAQLASELVKALELESLPWEKDRIKLVYRVGVTLVRPGDGKNPFSRADVALKKAERGHSILTVFEDGNDERESAYQYVIRFTELVNNRDNGTFKAVFQPVFNADGTVIEWYEALLRLKRQDGAYVSIHPYLGVAKSTGFYQHLTDFILRESVSAILEFDVDVSVNVSITDIVRPEFIALVDEVYGRIRHKRGRIIFEILESDELVELDACVWFIDYISNYGFKIAIDDFGTGYSNYCNLISLPVDIVKIDGSLIRKVKDDESARILVEGIVHFCKKSNKKTVAEFVENSHVFDSVRKLEIDYLQGYFLSEPASIPECPCPSA